VVSTDRAAGAVLLRSLRQSRGWSWADLARALRDSARQYGITTLVNRQLASIQRTVARWESISDLTGPGERYQFLLAQLYMRTPAGSVALGTGSDFAVLLDAFRAFGTAPARIHQLVELITKCAGGDGETLPWIQLPVAIQSRVVEVLREPARLNRELLGDLNNAAAAINEQIGSMPFIRLQLSLAPIAEVLRRLLPTDQQPELRNELLIVATHTLALTARLAFETCDDQAAVALYREATATAGLLDDVQHRVEVSTSHTMVTLHAADDVNTAHKISASAVRDAQRCRNNPVQARAYAVHAEVCARAERGDEARSALDWAWKIADRSPAGGHSDDGFSADRLAGFDGLCALHLGESNRAHDALARSVATLAGPRASVQRGIVTADLALARLRLGDPAACVELMHAAVDIVAQTGGRVSGQRVRQVRGELRPWRSEGFVNDLDEHIHDKLVGR
jgi:transcriptional regulator with XRE-family HTH domain